MVLWGSPRLGTVEIRPGRWIPGTHDVGAGSCVGCLEGVGGRGHGSDGSALHRLLIDALILQALFLHVECVRTGAR